MSTANNTSDLRERCDIPEFRVTDALSAGIMPMDYVLNVRIFADCSQYLFHGLDEEQDFWDIEHPRRLLAGLEHLFGFKKGTKITIGLKIEVEYLEPRLRADGLNWLINVVVRSGLPSLLRLDEAGYKVMIHLRTWNNHRLCQKWNGTVIDVCVLF